MSPVNQVSETCQVVSTIGIGIIAWGMIFIVGLIIAIGMVCNDEKDDNKNDNDLYCKKGRYNG